MAVQAVGIAGITGHLAAMPTTNVLKTYQDAKRTQLVLLRDNLSRGSTLF